MFYFKEEKVITSGSTPKGFPALHSITVFYKLSWLLYKQTPLTFRFKTIKCHNRVKLGAWLKYNFKGRYKYLQNINYINVKSIILSFRLNFFYYMKLMIYFGFCNINIYLVIYIQCLFLFFITATVKTLQHTFLLLKLFLFIYLFIAFIISQLCVPWIPSSHPK